MLTAAAMAAVVLVGAACAAANQPDDQPTASPQATVTPVRVLQVVPRFSARPVGQVPAGVWVSWAKIDLDGQVSLGGRGGTNDTASMIKVAIVADVLRAIRAGTLSDNRWVRSMMRSAVIDSSDGAAETLYRRRGLRGIDRVFAACSIRGAVTVSGWWSLTRVTALQAARMGACIARGDLLHPGDRQWLLAAMRAVRGAGRFGIVETRPRESGLPLAYKNGWLTRPDGLTRINCLGISRTWTLAELLPGAFDDF